MIFSSISFNSSIDKVPMDTSPSNFLFPSFTLCLTILIPCISHAVTLSILQHDENVFRICGTISSSSTLLMFTVTVALTSGFSSFSSKTFLSPWFTQLDSSFHKISGPFTQLLILSWFD